MNQIENKRRSGKNRSSKRVAEVRKRRLKIAGKFLGIGVVVWVIIYLALSSTVKNVPEDEICSNVYIENVDVSGMKAKEAVAALEEEFAVYPTLTVSLEVEDSAVEVTLADLGVSVEDIDGLVEKAVSYGKEGNIFSRYSKIKDLEENKKVFQATFTVDSASVETVIAEKVPALENGAKNATITREGGKFVLTDEAEGVAIDLEESKNAIEKFFNKKWKQGGGTIELVTKVEKPTVTREQLETIQDVLGTFTTYCGSGGGRVQNIERGAALINGSVVMPGEEYSADAAMRPYTVENGFAEAGSYENGKVVQSMGGGICQVSSTLYNAVLLSELEVTQRKEHSMLVDYVEPAMDAAIAGDYKDLKFKNNTETPIYLEASISGGYITFTIYGKETRAEGRTVKYISETLTTTPAGKSYSASNDALGTITNTGSGHTGKTARLWKVVYENGVEVSREVVNNSSYASSNSTYTVGTATDNAEAKAVVTNAIASNDAEKINAAIAQAKQIIADANAAAQVPTTSETTTPEATTPETTPAE